MCFIDKTGRVFIPLQFASVRSFSEGLAGYEQSGKWGFIDKSGRIVIPAQYDNVEDFSSGAAVVGTQYETVWFIDKTGRKLFDKEYTVASSFRLGLAHVSDGKSLSYINREGRAVFTYRNPRE